MNLARELELRKGENQRGSLPEPPHRTHATRPALFSRCGGYRL